MRYRTNGCTHAYAPRTAGFTVYSQTVLLTQPSLDTLPGYYWLWQVFLTTHAYPQALNLDIGLSLDSLAATNRVPLGFLSWAY